MTFFDDKTLTCRACRGEFVFSAGEQEFFAKAQLVNEPKKCPDCRVKMKAHALGRESTQVDCADCGKSTVVPFKPTGKRPVYCDVCMRTRKQAEKQAETSG